TSKFEGLPNVLLEAQLFKKFIISSNCPTGPKEILLNGKAGNLFNVGNFKELSKYILQYDINKNKNKIQLGFNNLKRFNFDQCMNEYYNSIIKFL
ncbi:glycosyltransferase, partial [Candidatus Pelagibacter sp.]|nr:glycosyltransferase [Candidatus Pelagibacter sp.]